MHAIARRDLRLVVPVTGAAALAPFLLLSFFNHPLADDFCVVAKARDLGFWRAEAFWYRTWSGRYFALATVNSFAGLSHWMVAHKVLPAMLLGALLVSIYFFVRELFGSSQAPVETLVATTMLSFLFMLRMPSVVEGIYWLNGALTYQLANVLMLLLGIAMLRVRGASGRARVRWLLASHGLVIAIVGLNETSMSILDFLLLAVFAIRVKGDRRADRYLLGLLATAAVCSFIVIAAPGNSIRLGYFPDSRRPLFAVLSSIDAAGRQVARWILESPILLFTIAYIPWGARVARERPAAARHFRVHPLGALAIFGAVLLGAWFPAFWSMGLPPPPRTANVIYFIFLIGWFFNTQVLIQYLMEKRGIAFSRLPLYSLVLLFAATGMYVLPENNVRAAWGDLVKGRAARYDRDMRRRYEAIRRCGGSLCEVDDLTARPSTLLFTDITKDEKFWANGCVADVFERKAVRIRRPSVP